MENRKKRRHPEDKIIHLTMGERSKIYRRLSMSQRRQMRKEKKWKNAWQALSHLKIQIPNLKVPMLSVPVWKNLQTPQLNLNLTEMKDLVLPTISMNPNQLSKSLKVNQNLKQQNDPLVTSLNLKPIDTSLKIPQLNVSSLNLSPIAISQTIKSQELAMSLAEAMKRASKK